MEETKIDESKIIQEASKNPILAKKIQEFTENNFK